MILTIPALYRARVVLPGHRNPRDVLLAAETNVRIGEIDGAAVIRMRDSEDAYDPDERAPEHNADYYPAPHGLWGEHRIYGFRDSRRISTPTTPAGLASRLWAAVAHGSMGKLASTWGSPNPFVLDASVAPPAPELPQAWQSGFRVYPETTPFRSMTPWMEEARDRAIAHAVRVARSMAVHAGTGHLLAPSVGPLLSSPHWIQSLPLFGIATDPDWRVRDLWPSGAVFTAEQGEEYAALQAEWRRTQGLDDWESRPLYEIEVLARGCTGSWDPSETSMVAALESLRPVLTAPGTVVASGTVFRDALAFLEGVSDISRAFPAEAATAMRAALARAAGSGAFLDGGSVVLARSALERSLASEAKKDSMKAIAGVEDVCHHPGR